MFMYPLLYSIPVVVVDCLASIVQSTNILMYPPMKLTLHLCNTSILLVCEEGWYSKFPVTVLYILKVL